MKEARACCGPRLINSFFVSSSIILPVAGAYLWRSFSFIVQYFSTSSSMSLYSSSKTSQFSSALEIWLWTVLSFDAANMRTASCFAALAEQRREMTTPAMSNRPATPVTTSSVIPTTKPMPETNRPALTAPLMIQVVPSEAHVPSTALTALRYFL